MNRLVSYLTAMVGKGSPKLNMIARASPKLHRFLGTTSGIKKKASPKCSKAKKTGGSPRGMVFNSMLLLLLFLCYYCCYFFAVVCY